MTRRRWISRRWQKIWMAIGVTCLVIAMMVALGLWVDRQRNTDFADARGSVVSELRHTELPEEAPQLRFVEVAESLGIQMRHGPGARRRLLTEDSGSGLAWGDVDGDGDFDLYVVNFPGPDGPSEESANRLFRNDGGDFTDVTDSAGVADAVGFGMGASFADYDGDGHLDLYVTNDGTNRLFRNRGDGTFEDVALSAGVADGLWSTGVAWGDFDRDGDLDLYLCNYVHFLTLEEAGAIDSGTQFEGVPFTLNPNSYNAQPNRLYRNRGDGTFADVAVAAGVDDPEGRSLGATFCDLDGDGWLDLYVNNDVSQNRFFRNLGHDALEGELQFVELSAMTGTADPRGSMGLSIGDLAGAEDGGPDGRPEMFITHWIAQENALYQAVVTTGGALEFRDKTRKYRLGEVSTDMVGWGTAMVDLDRDGRLDIVAVNGSTLERPSDTSRLIADKMFLFWNDGTRFYDLAPHAGTATRREHDGRGLAAADYDGDGDVDLAISTNRNRPLLLRNDTETSHRSLTVRLAGPASARFGARVEVRTSAGPQFRWWGADASFLSMHAPDLIFGLGQDAAVSSIEVLWADGQRSTRQEVRAGLVVLEHPGESGDTLR